MKTRKNWIGIATVIAMIAAILLSYGCAKKSDAQVSDVDLCISCGQIKGTDTCCKPDAPKCSGCELAKGSPGCCKIPDGAESASICGKCGQIKGTDECCKPDQPTCESCGLVKDSPGCCKLPKK